MHIAVCDTNVADRKQMERLLKREGDKRISTEPLYVNFFGNAQALFASPLQYHAFYIDVCKMDGINGVDIVNRLIAQGTTALIILCCSDINYREFAFPDNVTFLDKPIKSEELSATIDHALEMMAAAESFIELRDDTDTFYVTEPDILYAVANGRHMIVSLTDGRKLSILITAANLYAQLEKYPVFLAASSKVILNGRHIQKIGVCRATMINGDSFFIHRDYIKNARAIYQGLHQK